MSEIAEIIDTLEIKIEKLFAKIDSLEEKNQALKEELKNSAVSNQKQLEVIATLKKEQETLKMANSLLGSEDYKRDTKLKINSLIRDIDYCIAQLSD
jgi:cell division septum initiation protein DivIVA